MGKRIIALAVGLLIVPFARTSLAQGPDVEISPVNKPADLDLSGNILYAVNFGNNGNPTVGGIVFSADEQCPGLTRRAADFWEGTAAGWGAAPGTGDAGLNLLLNGFAATSIASDQLKIDAQGLVPGESYLLQIIVYDMETHSRKVHILVEGKEIATDFNPIAEQGGVIGQGGSVIKYQFIAGDAVLNIAMVNHEKACGLSGLILAELSNPTFADYGSGTTTELVSGKGTWQINWGQGPWTWTANEGEPLFGSNVSSVLALQTTAPAAVSADLVATLPVAGTLTLSARDKSNADTVIGTMTLRGTGVNIVDINAARVVADQGSGIGLAPFHPPGPELAMTLDAATGVFAYIQQAGDWRLELAGLYAMPLTREGITQAHIFAALGGKVPLIGGLGTFALSGEYKPVESLRPQSFCEYGMGFATQFGAAGAQWTQIWGVGPWPWRECPTAVNAKFLGASVTGELETTTSGAPAVDSNMMLRSPFVGRITLTKHSGTMPDQVDGQIVGDVAGAFVGDINAANATFDAEGNIVCAFGVAVHDAPDAMITVTEATGIYADIRQAGDWGWYVNGTMTIARIPDLPLQQNILAALQQPELLLGAQEEFVLTGWYYRQTEQP